MSSTDYTPPASKLSAFHCPHCGVYSKQRWGQLIHNCSGNLYAEDDWEVAVCEHCSNPNLWLRNQLIYPKSSTAPLPNQDLPEEIRSDYLEARKIVTDSPRGAAALLRLCIQKLCIHLEQPGKNINDDIAALVKAGLPSRVQAALDAVRVIGNNAVHPGKIDLHDNVETVHSLFKLVNFVTEKMISEPKHIDQLYGSLPEGSLNAIEKRDKK
jgi:hypothetical protein